jgi:hypothetical protein
MALNCPSSSLEKRRKEQGRLSDSDTRRIQAHSLTQCDGERIPLLQFLHVRVQIRRCRMGTPCLRCRRDLKDRDSTETEQLEFR